MYGTRACFAQQCDICDKVGPLDYAVDAQDMIVKILVNLIRSLPDECQLKLDHFRFSPEHIVSTGEVWLDKMSVSIVGFHPFPTLS
jgi:hypothetical protein